MGNINIKTTEELDSNKLWLLFQESDRQLKETRATLKEFFKETYRQFKEMIIERKEFDKKTRSIENLFTSQWGSLVESLVEGKLVKLLNDRGIPVNQTTQRYEVTYNNKQYEFDIIAINGTDAVIVEVKTVLSVKHVKEFIEKMTIIKAIGDSAFITDPVDFNPKGW